MLLHSARTSLLILGLACIAILGSHAPSATAGVLYVVDSTTDAVDASPGDGACATSLNECTLRAAVQESNALVGPATITVPAGSFILSIAGTNEDSAATGDLDITDTLHVEGAGMDATIIDGGGIDRVFHNHSGAELLDMTIQHGNADDPILGEGGGIYNQGQLEVQRAKITLNSTLLAGGGISSRGDGTTLSITESVIDSNTSDNYSGGIYTRGDGVIVDSTISNNIADLYDGGITNDLTLTVLNSTISGNSATNLGGLHTTAGSTSSSKITNSTIVDNEGGDNGGLRITGGANVTITNSIVANNSGENCLIDTSSGSSVTSLGHNLGSDNTCDFSGSGDMVNTNPLIGPLQDNGGLTSTHALLQGSPAVDAGDDALCPGQDQRGVTRPQGPHCDVGSYEATGDEPTPTPGGDRIWGDNNCSGLPPDPVDSLLTLRFDAGLGTNTGECPAMGEVVEVGNASPHPWGDVDCGGDVNPVDSLKLLRFDAGLDVAQPDGCPELGTTVTVSPA